MNGAPQQSESTLGTPAITMSFRPIWAYIDGVREFGRFFCETTFAQPDFAARAQVALQETIENAVRHAEDESAKLTLEITCNGPELRISTVSRATPEHVRFMRDEVEMLRAFDPEAGYLAAFARAAREPHSSPRLALARLRYEARFDVQISDEPNGHVRVTAIGKP